MATNALLSKEQSLGLATKPAKGLTQLLRGRDEAQSNLSSKASGQNHPLVEKSALAPKGRNTHYSSQTHCNHNEGHTLAKETRTHT